MSALNSLQKEMDHCFALFSESIALRTGESCWTFNQIKQDILQLQAQLAAAKIGKNHFIGLHLQRGVSEYLATLALMHGQYTGINLGSEGNFKRVLGLCEDYDITHLFIPVSKLAELTNAKISFIYKDICCIEIAAAKVPPSCAWLLMTSGSTGKKKFVMISEDDLLVRAQEEIRCFALKKADIIFNYLSFAHDLGLNQLLTSFFSGAQLFLHRYVFLADFVAQLEKSKATVMTSIPNLWRHFIKMPEGYKKENSHLRLVTISGGSLSNDEIISLQNILGQVSIVKTYGQTETFRSLMKVVKVEDGTLGNPINGVRLEIDQGELIHFGSGTMLGYWKDEKGTRQKFNKEGGILTGDYFELTTEGDYVYLGRKDDQMKVNGVRFYPEEIENILIQHEAVLDCAVILINETILAFVVYKNSAEEAKLRHYLQENIGAQFIPKYFLSTSVLPKTVSGKIDRMDLKTQGENFLLRKNNE